MLILARYCRVRTAACRPGAGGTSPSARCLTGMLRPEGRHASPSKELSTEIRRYDGSGSDVVIRSSSTSAPRLRSRLRSTIGFEMFTACPSPVPVPLPPPNSVASNVGTSSGTTAARAVAVRPIFRAEDQTAAPPMTELRLSKGPPRGVRWWPQWESRLSSSAAMRNRKQSAAAANFSTETPPSRMLTGAV